MTDNFSDIRRKFFLFSFDQFHFVKIFICFLYACLWGRFLLVKEVNCCNFWEVVENLYNFDVLKKNAIYQN